MTSRGAGRGGRAGSHDVAELADRLYLAVLHLLRRMKRADDALGLSAAQLSAITRLVRSGPMTLGELARAEGVRPPTMSRHVKRLEQEGLVLKRASRDDGRVTRIAHTNRAVLALEEGRRRRVASFADQLGSLSAAERADLARAIDVLERLSRDPSGAASAR